jgi:hypothetical protein
MSNVKDTLFRYLSILQLIPRMSGRISPPSLQENLKYRGFDVSPRSLQRELRDYLSVHLTRSLPRSAMAPRARQFRVANSARLRRLQTLYFN